jgi:hypothetical protein
MADERELEESLDVAMATTAVLTAKIEVLQSAVWFLFEKTGNDQINGVPFNKWFEAEYRTRLQNNLISLEDKVPSVAAKLQAILDASDQRTGHAPQ